MKIIVIILTVSSLFVCFGLAMEEGKELRIKQEIKNETRYEIKSLSLNTEKKVNGSFMIFVGSYNERQETYFYWYGVNERGAIKLIKKNSNLVDIYEDEDIKPYYKIVSKGDFINTYELHIPKNSIKYNIDINLNKI